MQNVLMLARCTSMGFVETVMRAGSVARLLRVSHGDLPHVDPPEEQFAEATILFTVRGVWHCSRVAGAIEVNSGYLLLANAGESYRVRHDDDIPRDETFCLELDFSSLRRGCRSTVALDECMMLGRPFQRGLTPFAGDVKGDFQRILREAEPANPSLAFDLACLQLVASVHRATDSADTACPSWVEASCDLAREFIDARYPEDLSMLTISRHVCISPYYLARSFRRKFGISMIRYLCEKRIEAALQLLASNEGTLLAISHQVGFGSVSNFNRAFKRATGVSPSEYRAALRK